MPKSFWDDDAIIETPTSPIQEQKTEPIKNNNSFWGDDAIIENNGAVQSSVVVPTRVTSQTKPILPAVQTPDNIAPTEQPVYANNGVVQGGASKSSYLDAKGKLHFEDENESNLSGFKKFKRNVKARIDNFGNSRMLPASEKHPYVSSFVHGVGNDVIAIPQIINTLANLRKGEAEKEQARIVNAKIRDNWNRTMDYDKPRTTGQKIANLAGEMLPLYSNMQSLANKATPAILSTANKIPIISNMITKYPKLSKFMASLPPAMLEGAGWGVVDKGIRDVQGIESEGSYKDSALAGALAMGGLHGATHALPAVASKVANTKPIKAVRNAYNGLLNSETPLGNTIANIQGTLADTLGLDAVNETARKYQKLNRNISRGNTPLEKRFSKADIDEVNNATGLNEEQEKLIFDRLKNGDPKKSTVTKDQEEAKEFFDNLLKKEKVSEYAEGDLSHVKPEADVVYPKEDKTSVKTEASHVSDEADRYKIKISNDNVSEDNFFKKRTTPITREEALANASKNAGHPVTEFVPDEHAPQIKRSAYGGRVHIEKDGKPWIAYKKVKKLPSGNAEGSDAGNWYVHETQNKPKQIGADDLYESHLEELKPSTDADLLREIEQAKKGKQLPSVNKPFVNKSTAEKRLNDRLENEKAQMSWKQKLKTKVKALNSDDENDAKTLGQLIYGDNVAYNYDKNAPRQEKLGYNKTNLHNLEKSYPEFKGKFEGVEDTVVHINDMPENESVRGFYNYRTQDITLYRLNDRTQETKTLLHEVQHRKDDVEYHSSNDREFKKWYDETRNQLTSDSQKMVEFESENKKQIDSLVNIYNKGLRLGKFRDIKEFRTYLKERRIVHKFRIIKTHLDNLVKYRNNILEVRARSAEGGESVEPLKGYFDNNIRHSETGRNSRLTRNGSSSYKRNNQSSNNERSYRLDGKLPEYETGRIGLSKEQIQGEQRLAPTPQSFIKSIRNSSKHQEQIKIDFDIITQDQATNRLKQQTKDGEGVYFKQGFGKANDKIDLTRNYNESRENKVGHFGEKALEGLGKRGSTKDILVETKKEEIKLQHLKDSVDFIESEFAKPIPASGKVSEGYVAVNRNLLANAVYGNKSTAWYEMMSKGEKAIKKAFKNEKVAKYWAELAERNSKPDYQLPKQVFNKLFDGSGETVAEYWERYGKDHTAKAMLKTAGAILDAFNNSFKRGVLTSSSFVFNNRFGNQMMIMAKTNPVEYIKSFYQGTKLQNKDLPAEIIESSLLEAVDGYKARQTYTGWQPLDNFLNLCGGHTIDTSTLKTMKVAKDNGLNFKVIKGKTIPKKMVATHNAKSLGAEALNVCIGLPNKAFNKVCDKLMRVNEAMERYERKQVYGIAMNRVNKDLVKKTGQGMISQEALLEHIKEHPELEETIVKFIEDTLGDYNNFNKFEKKVLKRIVPFYSWYRTITRHTATFAKENPARCAMIFLELERLKEKDKDLKEWQRASIRTGVKDSRSHKELLINKTAQIPYSTFEEFVDESGKGGLSPAIKKPLEAIRGKQFFNDSEITSRRYMKHRKGWGVKAKDGYLDKKTGEFKEGELPLSPRLNYLSKEVLETVYPIMRSPLAKPEATIQGVGNLITKGEYKEPDKLYDADLGGYNKDDRFIGKTKRYAANDTSTTTKMLNRVLGLSLQNKQPLSKAEKEALKEKYKRQYKRMYD